MNRKHTATLVLYAGLVLALPLGAVAQQRKGEKKAESKATGVLAEEKGKFRVLVDGQRVGSEEFQISSTNDGWLARGNAEVNVPGAGSMKVNAMLRLDPNGNPLHYEWSLHGQKKASATIEFEGGTARVQVRVEGADPYLQEFLFNTPRVIILDNNLYHHYGILARLYDWNAKGTQSFPVLIPQGPTPGTITVESLGPQEVEGGKFELLKVRTADLEIDLYLDANRRLARLAVPASKAEVVREPGS